MKYAIIFLAGAIPFVANAFCTVPLVGQEETSSEPTSTRIQNCRSGDAIEMDQLISDLADADVVFLGEKHDNDSGHELQLGVIKGLVEAGHSIAITTEQFERDVQGALDDYLNDRIAEEAFLEVTRPWKNYQEHYRPIIEFAKANRIPVIAANIPRRTAKAVSSGVRPAIGDQAYMPESTSAPEDAYWDKFMATMEGHMGADGEAKLKLFYESQCLKDDAMAESIADFLATNSHQPKIVVHLCGHFHSDYGLGTAARVVQRRPLTRSVIVTMESIENESDESTLADLSSRAHYVFWVVKNQEAK